MTTLPNKMKTAPDAPDAPNKAYFVAALPLEICVQRLQKLQSRAHRLQLSYLSDDQVDFVLKKLDGSRVRVITTGRLRRWEGTLTRVDARMRVQEGVIAWALALLLMLVLTLMLVPLAMMHLLHIGISVPLWLLLSGFAVLCILGWVLVAERATPVDDTPGDLLALIEDALR